jgi:hypothetical protein
MPKSVRPGNHPAASQSTILWRAVQERNVAQAASAPPGAAPSRQAGMARLTAEEARAARELAGA